MTDGRWTVWLPKTHLDVIGEALDGYITFLDTSIQLARTRTEKDEYRWKQYVAIQLRGNVGAGSNT